MSLFFNIFPKLIDAFASSRHEFTFYVAVEIGLLHSEPFPLLRYWGIGDLRSVASEAQTNGSPTGQGQDCGVDGPEVPSGTTATTLVSDVRYVG
jgi:hypothetical protein